jgi:hypothetical protein
MKKSINNNKRKTKPQNYLCTIGNAYSSPLEIRIPSPKFGYTHNSSCFGFLFFIKKKIIVI